MNVSEKLDLLMKLTGTKNVTLAKAVSYDASYISRIRSGKRELPSQTPFIISVSDYMARRIAKDPQIRQLIMESVIPALLTAHSDEEIAACLTEWLLQEEAEISIGQLLTHIIQSSPRHNCKVPVPAAPAQQNPAVSPVSILKNQKECKFETFYGNAGKRKAVEAFLTSAIAGGGCYKLLLYSDESMSWLTEDVQFAYQWLQLILTFIRSGGKIEIIHTVRRDIGEMLDAVEKWMPIYMTGAMTSFYNPKLRDSILRRTLFLAVPNEPTQACDAQAGGAQTSNALAGGTQASNPLAGGTQASNALAGGAQSSNALAGGTQASNPLAGGAQSSNALAGGAQSSNALAGNTQSGDMVSKHECPCFALISDSIGDNTDGLLNLLIRDQQSALALVKEYELLHSLCRPLLKVYLSEDAPKVRQIEASLDGGILALLPGNIRILVDETKGALISSLENDMYFHVQEPNLTQAIAVYTSEFTRKD